MERIRFLGSSLYFPSLAHPIDPAARVLSYIRPAGIPRQPGGSPAPYAGLAVKDHLGILVRPGESESVFKVLVFDVETIRRRRDGDIDRARDPARLLKLAWFARICPNRNKRRRASQCPQDSDSAGGREEGGTGWYVPMSTTAGLASLVRFCTCGRTRRARGQRERVGGIVGHAARGGDIHPRSSRFCSEGAESRRVRP